METSSQSKCQASGRVSAVTRLTCPSRSWFWRIHEAVAWTIQFSGILVHKRRFQGMGRSTGKFLWKSTLLRWIRGRRRRVLDRLRNICLWLNLALRVSKERLARINEAIELMMMNYQMNFRYQLHRVHVKMPTSLALFFHLRDVSWWTRQFPHPRLFKSYSGTL